MKTRLIVCMALIALLLACMLLTTGVAYPKTLDESPLETPSYFQYLPLVAGGCRWVCRNPEECWCENMDQTRGY